MRFLADIEAPSNRAIVFDNSNNNSAYYIRNGGSNLSTLEIGTGTPGSNIKLSMSSAGIATFFGDITINKSTPKLTFNNLAGGGLDPSLTADGSNFTISTSSLTPLSLALDTGDATFAGDVFIPSKLEHTGDSDTFLNFSDDTIVLSAGGASTTLAGNGTVTFPGDVTVSGGDITLGGTGRIQGVDTVSANTDAASKIYVDNKFSGGVTQITAGTNVTISPSGGTGNVTINASGGGGGGSIGGSIAATQVAFGDTTADEINGVSTFTYSDSGGIEALSLGDATSGQQTNFDLSHPNTGATRARYNLYAGTSLKGYLQSSGTAGEVTLLSNANLVLDSGSTDDIIMATQSGAKVGIGNTSPSEKLEVTGRIKASAGVQVGTELDNVAASGTVGTFRYRLVNGAATAGTNYSYVDMVMQTGITGGISSYEWVNIVTNRW
mgnify:CR=1 FL=1